MIYSKNNSMTLQTIEIIKTIELNNIHVILNK